MKTVLTNILTFIAVMASVLLTESFANINTSHNRNRYSRQDELPLISGKADDSSSPLPAIKILQIWNR